MTDVMKAVLATGWRGPWSYEVSIGLLLRKAPRTIADTTDKVFFETEQSKDDLEVPEKWTQEAMRVHAKLIAELETSQRY